MILEKHSEKLGLTRDREYFVQEFLKDSDGAYLVNEDGNKMQIRRNYLFTPRTRKGNYRPKQFSSSAYPVTSQAG